MSVSLQNSYTNENATKNIPEVSQWDTKLHTPEGILYLYNLNQNTSGEGADAWATTLGSFVNKLFGSISAQEEKTYVETIQQYYDQFAQLTSILNQCGFDIKADWNKNDKYDKVTDDVMPAFVSGQTYTIPTKYMLINNNGDIVDPDSAFSQVTTTQDEIAQLINNLMSSEGIIEDFLEKAYNSGVYQEWVISKSAMLGWWTTKIDFVNTVTNALNSAIQSQAQSSGGIASGSKKPTADELRDYITADMYTDEKSIRENVTTTVTELNNHLLNYGMLSTWIWCNIGGYEFSTFGGEQNYIQSLQVEKNGSGCCNSFTLTLAYVPAPGSDINQLEKVFALETMKLQYGYNKPYLYSPCYVCRILDYKVAQDKNYFIYTLTGISSIIATSYDYHNFSEIGTYASSGELMGGIKPTDAVMAMLKIYLGDTINTVTCQDSGWQEPKEAYIPSFSNVTIWEYIEAVLDLAEVEGEEDSDTKTKFKYKISDTISDNGKPTIKIYAEKFTGEVEADNKISFTFSFGSGFDDKNLISNVVQSFSTGFQGVMVVSQYGSDSQIESFALDDQGQVVSATFVKGSNKTTAATINEDVKFDKASWASATQYSYSAELTALMLPCEIPIGTYIEVLPMVNGTKCHTAGTYFVISSIDSISEGNATTTLKLVKMIEKSKLIDKSGLLEKYGSIESPSVSELQKEKFKIKGKSE